MPATLLLCERNGLTPGIVTTNVTSINWKANDDSSYTYTAPNDIIISGTNSYEKYQYLQFVGSFTSIGNIAVTHSAGVLPSGVALKISPPMTVDSDRAPYVQPTRDFSTVATTDISVINTSVPLFVGPLVSGTDGAASSGKASSASKVGTTVLYSNYIVTQLQTQTMAPTGDTGMIGLEITYDEV